MFTPFCQEFVAGKDSNLDTDDEFESNPDHELFKRKVREAQKAADDLGVEIPVVWRELSCMIQPGLAKFSTKELENRLIEALKKVKDLSPSEQRVSNSFLKKKTKMNIVNVFASVLCSSLTGSRK